jgi:hypothetical protein
MLEVSGGATGDNKLREKAAEDSEVTVHIWGAPTKRNIIPHPSPLIFPLP